MSITAFATTAQIKTRIGYTGSSVDTIIAELALGVTLAIERHAGRKLSSRNISWSERYSGGNRILRTAFAPILGITTIKESSVLTEIDFSDATKSTTLVLDTDYIYQPGEALGLSGILIRLSQLWAGNDTTEPGMIQLVYQAGYEAGSAWPFPDDLVSACITQVVHELETRQSPGKASGSLRGVSIASGASSEHVIVDLLPSVKAIALSYRRFA